MAGNSIILHRAPVSIKKSKATLDSLLSTVERGFAAVADDITDIKSKMATKDDIANLGGQLTSVERELKSIRRDLDDLREKVENVSGFQKEIDHALERIAAIEKHLGLDKKIAAQFQERGGAKLNRRRSRSPFRPSQFESDPSRLDLSFREVSLSLPLSRQLWRSSSNRRWPVR